MIIINPLKYPRITAETREARDGSFASVPRALCTLFVFERSRIMGG